MSVVTPHRRSSGSTLLQTLERLLAIKATALKPALTAASNLIAQALGAEKVDAFLYHPDSQTLIAAGVSETPLGQLQKSLGLHQLPLANGGRAVQVFQTGVTYENGHVENDMEELKGIREVLKIRSVIAVALDVNGDRRGVLQVDSTEPEVFTSDDCRFLEAVAHWVGLVIERAELVERLVREAAEDARRLAAEEIVTVLAHDLRNYLTPLLAKVYIIRTRAEREGRASDIEDAASLVGDVQRLTRLIKDLLDVARIEQGVFAIIRQPFNISELVQKAVRAIKTDDFEVAIEAPVELVAEIDPERIQQALENLLANARQHAGNSPVTVGIKRQEQPDNLIVIAVTDNGPGIPEELIPRLLERYVRGQKSRGLGLGLYVTRGIAEAHGGRLEISSKLGQGSTFSLVLPVQNSRSH